MESFRFRSSDPNSHLVLFDFGLSCPAGPFRKMGIAGTPLYMAPEILSQWYTTQVDLWSIGIMFYTMLVGRTPFLPSTERRAISTDDLQKALGFGKVQALPVQPLGLLGCLLTTDPQRRLT